MVLFHTCAQVERNPTPVLRSYGVPGSGRDEGSPDTEESETEREGGRQTERGSERILQQIKNVFCRTGGVRPVVEVSPVRRKGGNRRDRRTWRLGGRGRSLGSLQVGRGRNRGGEGSSRRSRRDECLRGTRRVNSLPRTERVKEATLPEPQLVCKE